MKREEPGNCALCPDKACHSGKNCWGDQEEFLTRYLHSEDSKFLKAASSIEAGGYCQLNRLQELIRFCTMMDYKKIGLAFCVGLSSEAEIFTELVSYNFRVISVCCKICALDKKNLGLPQIRNDRREFACNPIAQVEFLNQRETDLNVIFGLCMGHDIVFNRNSIAPVTTFLVKDRILGHNPVNALYCQYIRRNIAP